MEQCETCRFWQLIAASDGECRRRAPVPMVASGSFSGDKHKPSATWPTTHSYDGCGEHDTEAPGRSQFFDTDSVREDPRPEAEKIPPRLI